MPARSAPRGTNGEPRGEPQGRSAVDHWRACGERQDRRTDREEKEGRVAAGPAARTGGGSPRNGSSIGRGERRGVERPRSAARSAQRTGRDGDSKPEFGAPAGNQRGSAVQSWRKSDVGNAGNMRMITAHTTKSLRGAGLRQRPSHGPRTDAAQPECAVCFPEHHASARNARLISLSETASGSKPPPTQSVSSSCRGWFASARASSSSA